MGFVSPLPGGDADVGPGQSWGCARCRSLHSLLRAAKPRLSSAPQEPAALLRRMRPGEGEDLGVPLWDSAR